MRRLREFYAKHERWGPAAFFLLGFLVDVLTLQRIDDAATLVQQAIYLAIVVWLVIVEILETVREVAPPRWLARVWRYREFLLVFSLGALLNSYTIFYFKSASSIASFLFIAILVAVLLFNEFVKVGRLKVRIHVAMVSLCVVSTLASLAPIVLGFVGHVPFLVAVVASIGALALLERFLAPRLTARPELVKSHVVYPFGLVLGVFVLLYLANLIPPVPLSVKYLGIYHAVEKKDGAYHLTYTRSKWKFWQNGDQSYAARAGDVLVCFAQVFSPGRFKDKLVVHWLRHDERRGWETQDRIPVEVTGGRDEGYRLMTKKSHYQPGEWRVQVETDRGREVGRLRFTIEADPGTEPPEPKTEIR
jgi:hypothetical protein